MALTLWASAIRKSILGQRLGIDDGEFLTGPLGFREPYESLTAAATMANSGVTALSGSTATFTIQAPGRAGILKEIINASSVSTAAMAIVRSTANGQCSFLPLTSGTTAAGDSSDVKRLNLINVGAAVTMRAISTSQWAITSMRQSSLYFTISTSS